MFISLDKISSIAKSRVFHLSDDEVTEILFCDNNDTEEAFYADDEDIGFLESDVELFENRSSSFDDTIEITIDHPGITTEK